MGAEEDERGSMKKMTRYAMERDRYYESETEMKKRNMTATRQNKQNEGIDAREGRVGGDVGVF